MTHVGDDFIRSWLNLAASVAQATATDGNAKKICARLLSAFGKTFSAPAWWFEA